MLIGSAVVAIATPVSTQSSQSQCLNLQVNQIMCSGPNNCSQTVPVNQVYEIEYGWFTGLFPVSCCGHDYYMYYEETPCDGEVVYPRIPVRALAAVASLQPLLIRNCAGGYDPYTDHPAGTFDVQKSLDSHSKIALN
jgi:hypothetical protein